MAEWFIFRRYSQYFPFPLSLPLLTQFHAQVLDPHRVGLPGFQSHFLLVRSRKAHSPQLLAAVTDKCYSQGNYYIAFIVLTNAMEDPSFNFKGIHIANVILEYFYVGLVLMCFILALGNRPQGSKWAFTLAFVGFAILTVYMTVSRSLKTWRVCISDIASFSSPPYSSRTRVLLISQRRKEALLSRMSSQMRSSGISCCRSLRRRACTSFPH